MGYQSTSLIPGTPSKQLERSGAQETDIIPLLLSSMEYPKIVLIYFDTDVPRPSVQYESVHTVGVLTRRM